MLLLGACKILFSLPLIYFILGKYAVASILTYFTKGALPWQSHLRQLRPQPYCILMFMLQSSCMVGTLRSAHCQCWLHLNLPVVVALSSLHVFFLHRACRGLPHEVITLHVVVTR